MRIPRKEHPIMHHVKEVKLLVDNLNKHRHAYYNLNTPEISDAEYDRMYDQLKKLEVRTAGKSGKGDRDHLLQFPNPDRRLPTRQRTGESTTSPSASVSG